ncbi:MAG: hypothetical protein CVT49_03410 [candidate division Zixibacteria bacterium HGW-Zixibacteria-1]|nr:MAG: hypothetical protein CVT49_03410 [candidate division Zixibacteria bacterium HGW-Zixibacteria-1]
MKMLLLFGIFSILIIAGCSDKEGVIFDPTYVNDGFKGITYTAPDGAILGPVDSDDWRMFSGSPTFVIFKENINGQATNSEKVIPDSFAAQPAFPNPTNSEIVLQLSIPLAGKWQIIIIDDDYRSIKTFEGTSDAGIVEVVWDGTDQSGRKVIGDVYRVVYEFGSCWGYGDIWLTDFQVTGPRQHN